MDLSSQTELEPWLRNYLKPLTDRIAQLDWQAALLHARLMVAERLAMQTTVVMSDTARIAALEEVKSSISKELDFAASSPGLEVLAGHLRDQITRLDNSLETMRAVIKS